MSSQVLGEGHTTLHFLFVHLPTYRKKFYSHFLYATFYLKRKATSTPSVPNLEGKPPWPRASIAANHLANRKFQRPRHICVLSAFSG